MSSKKIRLQKQQAEKRRKEERKAAKKELEDLRARAISLENTISKRKKENLNIRNLRIFKYTCNFISPFVISAGLTIGVVGVFGGGLPFHVDEITKYKIYSLNYQTDGSVTMDESYITRRWYSGSLRSNELIVYTPWECIDNQYFRYKRYYDVDTLSTLDLFDAVLEEDYFYIE